MTRLWIALGAVVVLAGAVLVYVFTSGQSGAAPAAKPAPVLTPLTFEPSAAWATPKGATPDVLDGVALVDADGLKLLDAATGRRLWQRSPYKDLPDLPGFRVWGLPGTSRLVTHDGAPAVLTGYVEVEAATSGLMLLSAEDASVLSRVPLGPVSGPDVAVTAFDDRVAVVVAEPGDTAVYSLESGKRLWTRSGARGVAVAGDTVLATTGDTVAAFDLSTGEPRWDLGDRYDTAEVVLTGGDAVLTRITSGARTTGKLLTVHDGTELADVAETHSCAMDAVLLACGGRGTVVVHDLKTGKATETGARAAAAVLVRDGRIFVESENSEVSTIDAAGNEIDASLPGRVVAMTDDLVCFRQAGGSSSACHLRR